MGKIEDKYPHTISDVATMLGLTQRTLRFYEELHLISPKRISNTRRRYSDADVAHLQKITRLARFGFSLIEVKQLLTLKTEDQMIGELHRRHDEISTEIDQLQQILSEISNEVASARQNLQGKATRKRAHKPS